MLKNLHLLILSVLLSATYSFSQSGLGTIRGSVIDGDTKQPVPYAKVLLIQNGTVKGGANTDDDGKFQINSVAPGSYDVEVRNEGEGYQPTQLAGVIVNSERITFLDNMEVSKPSDVKQIDEVVVTTYRVPLISKDGAASGATVTREDISRLPVRSAAG
ncbi:MAG TPA: carboxypeptidase regulatory-like domain-containing protein, partial [Taishania sp.]|nr:carboxypeptidase regulatory-like domain-containing protein [Taishania sp.]